MRAAAFRISVGAVFGTLTALYAIWRDRRHEAARERDLETFRNLIAGMPTPELEQLRSDYRTLAAFDPNPQFRRKRDACDAELVRRSPTATAQTTPKDRPRSVSLWES